MRAWKILEPTGRLVNWTKDEYEEDKEDRERSTVLKHLTEPQGPRAYYLNKARPKKDTKDLLLGRLFHEYLLTGEETWHESNVTRNQRHEAYKEELKKANGLPILNSGEADKIRDWYEGAMRCQKIRELINGPRYGEQVVTWEEHLEATDGTEFVIRCKASFDIWASSTVWDIKTTKAQNPEQYRRQCYQLNYPFSAAFYLRGRDAVPELKGHRCEYSHIVVGKEYPNYSYIWPMHPAWIMSAGTDVTRCLVRLAECRTRESEGIDPLEAWPDLVENEADVLMEEEWMLAKRGVNPNDYDPMGGVK